MGLILYMRNENAVSLEGIKFHEFKSGVNVAKVCCAGKVNLFFIHSCAFPPTCSLKSPVRKFFVNVDIYFIGFVDY